VVIPDRKESVSTPTPMPLILDPRLIELQQELLSEQIRQTRAEADMAEIELATKQDVERDRLVKHGKIRLLNVNQAIGGQAADAWLDALQHWERRDPGEPIVVQINSPGGSVTDGLAIYDTLMRLRRKGHHVVTHGMGFVASMASVLLQAGDERIMDARAKLMLHEGSIQISGNGVSLSQGEREDLEALNKLLMTDIVGILTERSNLTPTRLKNKWRRKDWYLTAQEALDLGFVDRVE
jgi:ATP-dependent Clp endopeptidase proteolytic subunit ClpP